MSEESHKNMEGFGKMLLNPNSVSGVSGVDYGVNNFQEFTSTLLSMNTLSNEKNTSEENMKSQMSEEMRTKIEDLYKSMMEEHVDPRMAKYIKNEFHTDFVNGVWKSIYELKQKGFTKKDWESNDDEIFDEFFNIINENAVFFINMVDGENIDIAEERISLFIVENL